MVCVLLPKKNKQGKVPVYLNVYDLTPLNGYTHWAGLGVYHSGVQVHGVEYAFGAHEHTSTGIFEVEPKKCPGFAFRKSILIGKMDLDPKEVGAVIEEIAEEYTGDSYHLISRNCNHFCNDLCIRLTGRSIPRWVNRLARLGLICSCVLPPDLSETKEYSKTGDQGCDEEMKKLRSYSSRVGSSTRRTIVSSSSCPGMSNKKGQRQSARDPHL